MSNMATSEQMFLNTFLSRSLHHAKVEATSRRQRRSDVFGEQKTDQFYSRIENHQGISLERDDWSMPL